MWAEQEANCQSILRGKCYLPGNAVNDTYLPGKHYDPVDQDFQAKRRNLDRVPIV